MPRAFIILLLISGFLAAPALAVSPDCAPEAIWPTQSWTVRAGTPSNAYNSAVATLEKYAFTLTGKDADRVGIRTDSVIIVRHGEIVYEKYARGWTAAQAHEGWSVAKSVTSSLLGFAVAHNVMTLKDSVCKTFPKLPGKSCGVTAEALRELASGFTWTEEYEGSNNQLSSVIALLYGEGHSDMVTFVASHDVIHPPGTWYNYSSGDATVLAGMVDEAFLPTLGRGYPWKLLFTPLGITTAAFERDVAGHLVGGSYIYASPRDYAKLGYFWLHDGCWENNRLLPVGWMQDSTTLTQSYVNSNGDPGGVEGKTFWINVPVPQKNIPASWPDAPADAFAAEGHWGQYIWVIPSLDEVIVRLGDDRDNSFDLDTFLKYALAVGSS